MTVLLSKVYCKEQDCCILCLLWLLLLPCIYIVKSLYNGKYQRRRLELKHSEDISWTYLFMQVLWGNQWAVVEPPSLSLLVLRRLNPRGGLPKNVVKISQHFSMSLSATFSPSWMCVWWTSGSRKLFWGFVAFCYCLFS